MKRLFLILLLSIFLITPTYAVIPQGYDMFTWFNQIVGDLSLTNMKLQTYYEDWASLPTAVKTGIKSRVINKIDEAITRLTDLKTDVNAIQN